MYLHLVLISYLILLDLHSRELVRHFQWCFCSSEIRSIDRRWVILLEILNLELRDLDVGRAASPPLRLLLIVVNRLEFLIFVVIMVRCLMGM